MSENGQDELEQEPIGADAQLAEDADEVLENELAEAEEEADAKDLQADAPVEPVVDELHDADENSAVPVELPDALEPEEESDLIDETEADPEPAVEFEGDRPIVRELEYAAARGKIVEDEDDGQVERFESVAEAKAVVEGFLFSCNEPLTVQKLSRLMSNLHPKTVRGLLLELQWDYDNRHGALQIVEIAGGYQMSTRAFVAPFMFRMHKHKRRSALSPATLETLAIIAYRQPITKGEIETIRGVESGAPLRTLQELNLIEAAGRKEVVGRPQLYATGELFLKTFGLKSMADLPSISELKSRFMEEQKLKPVMSAQPTITQEVETPEPESENDDEAIEATTADEGDIINEREPGSFEDEQSLDPIGDPDLDPDELIDEEELDDSNDDIEDMDDSDGQPYSDNELDPDDDDDDYESDK